MRTVRVFISSPTDVAFERQRVQRVIERLNGQYAQVLRFEAIRWETRFYGAHDTFQESIPEARDCDVVIAVFWSRLGTALPERFAALPAGAAQYPGEPYLSGSAYELLTSLAERAARAAKGKRAFPEVYVFRKSAPPVVALGNPTAMAEAQQQFERLEAFFERWFRKKDGTFIAAYNAFEGTDEFERATETLLRDWVRENVEGAAAITWPIATLGSPFRGLATFDAKHAPVFFGRDRKVSRAIELLKDAAASAKSGATDTAEGRIAPDAASGDRCARPFLLIVGPSGSGKSSLMRAGLAPRLTLPGVVATVDVWRTAVMRLSDGPNVWLALAKALVQDGTGGDSAGFGAAVPEIATRTGRDAEGIAEVLARAPKSIVAEVLAALDAVAEEARTRESYERPLRADFLLLVDQLEDIYSASVDDDQRSAFAFLLDDLAATGRVWVVATLRGDLYERLISDRPWIMLKDSGATYDLAPPGPEELEEIVRKSAIAAGLQYETDPATGSRLDDVLLKDASGSDILPLLQFTLNRLFDERETREDATLLTFRAYRAMGGLDGAIDQAAEQAISCLGPTEVEALPRLLRMLAVPVDGKAGTAGSHLALAIRSVRSDEARGDPTSARLVDALLASRIVLASKGEDDASALIRIAHQRVFESWGRARRIIDEQRDFFRIRDDVEQQHQRWMEGGRKRQLLIPPGVAIAEAEHICAQYKGEIPPELARFVAASGSRARWRMRGLVTATVVFALVAIVALWQWDEAQRAQTAATENYLTARSTIDGLIKTFAGRLQNVAGITVDTVEEAFNEISKRVEELGRRAEAIDPTFDATRADLSLEFAKTYKKVKSPSAAQHARDGIKRLEALAAKYPGAPAYKIGIADGHDLVSDVLREQAPEGALVEAQAALAVRRELYKRDTEQPELALALSKSLTRVGDLLSKVKRQFKDADEHYDEALDLDLKWHLVRPTDQDWIRELSWLLNKSGDRLLAKAPAEALAYFEPELCLRRRLHETDRVNTLIQSDVSWSLDRVGRAKAASHDLNGAEAAFFEALLIRRSLLDHDARNEVWLRDLYAIVTRYGLLQIDRGQAPAALAYLSEAERLYRGLAERKALQSWIPPYDKGLEQARAQVGERAAELQKGYAAYIEQFEKQRVGTVIDETPRSEQCWPALEQRVEELRDQHVHSLQTGSVR